jgi:hypothetical protein
MPQNRAEFPYEKLRAAASNDSNAQTRVDALHRELNAERPASSAIREHVAALQKHASLQALIATWFEDPRTQAFIDELTATGL